MGVPGKAGKLDSVSEASCLYRADWLRRLPMAAAVAARPAMGESRLPEPGSGFLGPSTTSLLYGVAVAPDQRGYLIMGDRPRKEMPLGEWAV